MPILPPGINETDFSAALGQFAERPWEQIGFLPVMRMLRYTVTRIPLSGAPTKKNWLRRR